MAEERKLRATPAGEPTRNQLDEVRDILFGPAQRKSQDAIRGLEERLAALGTVLETERLARRTEVAALQAENDSLRNDLEARSSKLGEDLDDLGERLSGAKVDRKALAGLFDDIARRLREGGTP